jgi:hypothetical protein
LNWLTANNSSGSEDATIIVSAPANPTVNPRSAIITISCNGATSQTITVMQEGVTTGIEDISTSGVILYPVTVISKLFNSLSKPFSKQCIVIYSSYGIEVFSSNLTQSTTEVDMDKYAPGIYTVKIVAKNKVILIRKIIKK